MKFSFDIGASDGQLTKWLFVEWHNGGHAHGYPITLNELIRHWGYQP